MDSRLPRPERPLAFGRFVLDPSRRQLLRDGKPMPLGAKAYELLAILIAQGGTAVSREELYQELWPESFVEDGNLTQNVYMLRKSLDPRGDGRAIIQTLPRHGYRFAAEIRPVEERAQNVLIRRLPWIYAVAAVVAISILFVGGSSAQRESIPLPSAASTAYTLGMYHFNMRTPAELRRSLEYFHQAISEAPQSPLGYAGMAATYTIDADGEDTGSLAQQNYVKLAEYYRDAALQRDPSSPEAHRVSGFLAYRFKRDFDVAEREFGLALAANPNDAETHHWHASFHFAQGRIAEATAEWELAHRLEPTSEVFSRWLGIAYIYERRPVDAIHVLSEAVGIQPADHEAWIQLASALGARGDTQRALVVLQHVRNIVPHHKLSYLRLEEALVRVESHHGIADPATTNTIDRLAAQKRLDPWEAAEFYAATGNNNRAITLLRRKLPVTLLDLSMVRYDPHFDRLRSDPRFEQIFE